MVAILVGLAVMPFLASNAKTESATASPEATVTIINNSSGEIRHVYFSTSDNNWGPDQLNNTSIAIGGSQTLNVSCSAATVKVVAEDEGGCFYYQPVSCSENNSWTITGDSARDCGN